MPPLSPFDRQAQRGRVNCARSHSQSEAEPALTPWPELALCLSTQQGSGRPPPALGPPGWCHGPRSPRPQLPRHARRTPGGSAAEPGRLFWREPRRRGWRALAVNMIYRQNTGTVKSHRSITSRPPPASPRPALGPRHPRRGKESPPADARPAPARPAQRRPPVWPRAGGEERHF